MESTIQVQILMKTVLPLLHINAYEKGMIPSLFSFNNWYNSKTNKTLKHGWVIFIMLHSEVIFANSLKCFHSQTISNTN